MRGFTGKILWVDLSRQTWREETVNEAVYQGYLSGVGLGAYMLYHRLPPGADPLGPQNILGFVAGVLVGTGAMFGGRWMVVGKSPLTGGWGDANCGGNFGPSIKQCGYDGIFITGASEEPVYLFADGERVEFLPAADLWGEDAVETEALLAARHGKRARVACIGPAGEKRSLIAGIVNDRGRLAARSGLGAV
ncbi:MAG TPA: aldehyde ferredoxin oxidoreductase N-terminal domain-containing protein, partial [Candidatus Methylomirabilis sp.]|nr:aldehyde ferredoxin oxidoreductase N-terminal domain-containing protein [Candidatus Methylomirabilis sp.]